MTRESRRLLTAAGVRDRQGLVGDAVLIEANYIAAVGKAADLRGPGIEEVAYEGATILSGLTDHHFHPFGYATAVTRLTVKEASDFADLAERLQTAAEPLPPEAALVGSRLDDESLAEGRLPNRFDLDAAVSDRPVLLYRYCGHIAVANTLALTRAGIGADTADPDGGLLDRDQSGRPTGVLRETAVELVSAAIKDSVPAVSPADLLEALRGLAGLGLTRIHAIVAAGESQWCGGGDEINTLLEVSPDLPIIVDTLVTADSVQQLQEAAMRLGSSPRVRFAGWKEFSDGSLGGHTAAMHQPFSDRADTTGTWRLDSEHARRMSVSSFDLGGLVAIHAIGDLANDRVLDLYQQLLDKGADPAQLRIEHASVLTEAAMNRFGQMGITASVQPAFLASEKNWLERRIGSDRMRRTYPFHTLASLGVRMIGGSDCPVEPPNPWWGMAAARDRAGLVPEESLTAEQALALFGGTVRPGDQADLVIVDRDPVEVDADRLRGIQVRAVWKDGFLVDLSPELPFR